MGIRYIAEKQRFVLESKSMAYVLEFAGGRGHLAQVYWGQRLPEASDYERLSPMVIPHSSFESPRGVMGYEYIPWGELVYSEPTLKVVAADGGRGLALAYADHEVKELPGREWLVVRLRDERGILTVELEYEVFVHYDVIGRRQRILCEKGPLELEAARSFQTSVPWGNEYQLTHVTGMWTGEFQLVREPVRPGRKTIDSRRGGTSHQANPWFAVDAGATEDTGEVWYGHLAYSGSWEISVEQDAFGFVQLAGGVQSFDFAWRLEAGESFETPVAYLGYSREGFGGMSRAAHDFQRDCVLPESGRGKLRPVLYNSWEATYFEVSEAGQKALASKAAELGVELFVVDDGWFGERHSDQAGLGDWVVNARKFPAGLGPLTEHVHGLGMAFGLWVEPEMVNPDSDLYRAHPEWIYHFEGIPSTTSRNQYVLNLGRQDVQEFILGFMHRLLSEHRIDFIKWDMNRAFSEPGWSAFGDRQKELWVRHVQGLYRILDELRAAHPGVEFESCSGGGARIDLGIMSRTEQVWTSDNTDAVDRLLIQEGYSYGYNSKAMMCWVTDSPNWLNRRELPLAFRFHSAMMGSLGIGGNLNEWSAEELAEASQWIAVYKELRAVVQEGRQYRLATLREKDHAAVQYVSAEGGEAVVFAFYGQRHYGRKHVRLRAKGLDPQAKYRLADGSGVLQEGVSGAYLMEHGWIWEAEVSYDSRLYRIRRI